MMALLLVLHFVADGILQSREMGKKKSVEFEWLLKHLAVQFFVFLLVLLPISDYAFPFALLNAFVHGVIDWNVWRLYKAHVYKVIQDNPQHPLLTGNPAEPWKYWEDDLFFKTIMFDQMLHGLTLYFLMELFLS